ncbi:MAG: TIM barrel protein [Phycisphaera sp.]|nr:TIM barrel protein [Phycisphaera sp.]
MPIKLAFSTVACPNWTLDQVAAQAKAMGYHGVELRTLGPAGAALACDPSASDPRKVAEAFEHAGVEIALLSTSISLHPKSNSAGFTAMRQTTDALELASKLGCGAVRVFVSHIEVGESRQNVMTRVSQRLRPLADKAGELGVQLLLENSGSFALAKPWWWLLNLVDHPMLGLSWNVANAAASDEGPAVSVPLLNQRIRFAKVKDAKIGEGTGFVPLGEGTVQVQHFIKRLMGIGYTGYVSVEWDRLWLPSLKPAEEALPEALATLKKWITEIEEAIENAKPKPKPAKAVK